MEGEKTIERKEFVKLLKEFVNDTLNTFPELVKFYEDCKELYERKS